ncbi:MAG: hypothetical protein A2007_01945 [Verrucomicrobia bacterium GWC2_42_7]|nr:MAG: hypothetical protein A2007_01945 [Verrucomicrobia bacterium GWC2_42_7]
MKNKLHSYITRIVKMITDLSFRRRKIEKFIFGDNRFSLESAKTFLFSRKERFSQLFSASFLLYVLHF